MKLVINIPDDKYKEICSGNFDTDGYFKMNLRDAFRNCTKLPKGHGRLIDADALRKSISSWGLDDYTPEDFIDEINNTDVIIEADKGEQE